MNPTIELVGLRREFNGAAVLEELSFAVGPGEVFALLGRNGSGKTTAMRILLGFLEPDGGEARILGKPASDLAPSDRERIGYVPEGQTAFDRMHLLLRDLLSYEAATRSRFRRAFVEDSLRRFELPLDRPVARLSRGQKAQVALLLAAGGAPEVFVLDDPAMGLDPLMRREFLRTVIEYLADEGGTVLFSSHILPDVGRVADRIGILHQGRLIVDAPLEELSRRLLKGFWMPSNGRAEPADWPGIVSSRKAREGFELLLLDWDEEKESELASKGRLSQLAVPTLEELFCDLTASETALHVPLEGASR
jgi:ABC-2 type transport system ATP-binding protein